MIQAAQLIALFMQALAEAWGYIWGASGQEWTEAKQKAATREMTVKYGAQWIGRKVADCSGLFAWAFKQLGGYIYHGSNTIFKDYTTATGKLVNGQRADGQPIKPGTAVFLCNADSGYHHIGLYVGDNTVIEAKGTQYGVVTSKLSHWDYWGELKGIIYADADPQTPALKLGDRTLLRQSPNQTGADVTDLQSRLNALGFDCGEVDGVFGKKTKAGVMAFQKAAGLNPDGKFGPLSYAALLKMEGGSGEDATYTVTISGLDEVTAAEIMARYPQAVKVKEGGEAE